MVIIDPNTFLVYTNPPFVSLQNHFYPKNDLNNYIEILYVYEFRREYYETH